MITDLRSPPGVWESGDTAPCKVTPVILHGVVTPEMTGVTLHGVVSPEGGARNLDKLGARNAARGRCG